jgi:hypothetical protein
MICKRCGQEATDDTLCVKGLKHPVSTVRTDAGYSVRGIHACTPATIEPTKPRPKPERKPKTKPLIIRGIARQRIPGDTGVGDTVERLLAKMGGDQFKWVMERLGIKCGCEDRKAWLNRTYPYQ